MNYTLDDKERELVLSLLQDELSHLKGEIRRSETPAFTDELKKRRETLQSLIGKLSGILSTSAA